MRSAIAATVLFASFVLAAAKGDAMWVVRETKLLKDPNARAKVVTTIPAQTKVTWKGAATKAKDWQQVVTPDGKSGYVQTTSLTMQEPQLDTTRAETPAGALPDGGVDATETALQKAKSLNR